jgi:hypothetical protein
LTLTIRLCIVHSLSLSDAHIARRALKPRGGPHDACGEEEDHEEGEEDDGEEGRSEEGRPEALYPKVRLARRGRAALEVARGRNPPQSAPFEQRSSKWQ